MRLRTVLTLAACMIAALPFQIGAANYPNQPIELVAAGDPGGGLDLHARMIELAFQQEKLSDKPFTITNKGAGGGNVATAYMITQKGTGYSLQVNTNRVLLNPIKGTTQHTLKDMVPVARLTAEYEIWVVKADSQFKTAKDVIAALKKDPKSVSFGIGTAPPCTDQLNILIPCKSSGVDAKKVNIVAFRGGGDLATQILGGHVAVGSSSLSEMIELIKAGKLRAIAVSSPKSHPKLGKTPTWKSMGINVTLAHWRGIFGAPDMPKEAYDYWNKKFAALAKSKAWKDVLDKNALENVFLPGDKFKQELEKDNKEFKTLLESLGMTGAAK